MGMRWNRFGNWLRTVAVAGVLTVAMGAAVGASAATTSVSCVLGSTPTCQGLTIVGAQTGDSLFSSGTVGGQSADIFQKNTTPGNNPVAYIYLQVDRATGFLSANPTTMYLTVQYYDQSQAGACSTTVPCFLTYNYDSTIASAPVNGAYAGTTNQNLGGTAAWKTVTWKLTQTAFNEGENNQADFRIAGTVGVAVHSVVLSLQAPAAATSSTAPAKSTSGGSTTPAKATSSGTSALPKTGGSPLVPAAGGLLLCGGVALALTRKRASRS